MGRFAGVTRTPVRVGNACAVNFAQWVRVAEAQLDIRSAAHLLLHWCWCLRATGIAYHQVIHLWVCHLLAKKNLIDINLFELLPSKKLHGCISFGTLSLKLIFDRLVRWYALTFCSNNNFGTSESILTELPQCISSELNFQTEAGASGI